MRGWEGLPQFSKDMYQERYFLEDEGYEGWVSRVATAYSDDEEHAKRISQYIKNYWFHPSTPISSNAGRPDRGLPISCFTNEVEDSKEGIFDTYNENFRLGASGGGIGTDWSDVREIGAKIGANGESSGVIPFIKVSDSTTLAVSQGGLRRASQAVYLDVSHPEIEEFIDIRRPTGDTNRRSHNIHHGIKLSDDFMEAVESRSEWDLVSPKTGDVIKTIDAFDLFKKILISRMETGEPYILFSDTANESRPEEYKETGRTVGTSNLCTEIMLDTSKGTGVCCLSSINLEYYDEYEDNYMFFEDIHRFTDNVLESFIQLTKGKIGFEDASRSAFMERSIGIGTMGFHGYLQKKNVPFESLSARYLNQQIFGNMARKFASSNEVLGREKGNAPISNWKRNTHVMAIAPTASISTLCNLASQGIDPRLTNCYTHKTNVGSYFIKNKYLEELLETKSANTEDVWKSIMKNQGSVQHLDELTSAEKEVFKTAYELDQAWVVEHASDRQPYIDQGQSVNIFLPADTFVTTLYNIHINAWKKKLKSLYYLRSTALNRATIDEGKERECLSCQ